MYVGLNLNMRQYICCCFLLFSIWASASQKDSLLLVLKQPKLADSSRVNVYNQLADLAIQNRTDEGLLFAQKAFNIAQQKKLEKPKLRAQTHIGTHYLYANSLDSANYFFSLVLQQLEKTSYPSLKAELLKKKGVLQYYAGNTDSALFYFQGSLQINEQIGDSLEIIKSYNNIGAISLKTRKLDQALSYFYKCLAFDEKVGDERSIASDYNNIALVFVDKKDLGSAQKYLQKTIEIRRKLQDTAGLVKASINLGIVYTDKQKYKEVLSLLSPILKIISIEDFPDESSQILNNMAVAYKNLKQYNQALEFSNRALEIRKKFQINKDMPALLSNIGAIYLELKKYSLAIQFAKQGQELASQAKQIDIEKNAVIILVESHLGLNQSAKALEYFKKLNSLNEEFYNIQTAKQVAELQTQFETEKKENENKLLQQENDIKQLELMAQQAKISYQNIAIAALIASLLLVVILVMWRLNIINLRKKEQELLAAQKVQQEKERISRDLHDHVGGQLSFVLYTLEDLVNEDAAKRMAVSQSIQESVKQVIGNLRETIWAINDAEIGIQDFSDKLKLYARNMFRHTQIELIFEENITENIPMYALQGLNLFRISQEIINNAFKHAKAQKIHIKIEANTQIKVEISDNGIGYSEAEIEAGFGLKNIQKRAQETNIQVSVQTEPLKGVSYRLLV